MGAISSLKIIEVAIFYLPHLIFLLYKIGQSLFSPASKVYLYDSVCYDQFDDKAFLLISHRDNHSTHFDWTVYQHHLQNLSRYETEKGVNYSVSISSCSNLTGPAEDLIQLQAANFIMAMKILQNVPAFILGMFCGGWIDKVGQRIPMILSCFGGAAVAFAFVAIHLSGGVAIPGILVGITINSFTGRNTLVTTAIQSYISDRTTGDERTRQLGFILAMNFFGLFGGSLIMGFMADDCPFWTIFLVVAILYSFALILIISFLPCEIKKRNKSTANLLEEAKVVTDDKTQLVDDNNKNKENDEKSEEEEESRGSKFSKAVKSFFRIENFTDTLKTIFRSRPSNYRRYIILTFFCIFLQNVCKSGEIDVLLLFVLHSPLSWSKSDYGYLLSYQYASVGTVLIFVLPFLSIKLQLSDSVIIMLSTAIKAVGLGILGFSTQTWMVYLAATFASTFGMITSCLRSLVSKMVDEDESGRCFSIIASAEVISDLIGVVIFTRLYYLGLTYSNIGIKFPFLCIAVIHVLLLFVSLYIYLGIRKQPDHSHGIPVSEQVYESGVSFSPTIARKMSAFQEDETVMEPVGEIRPANDESSVDQQQSP